MWEQRHMHAFFGGLDIISQERVEIQLDVPYIRWCIVMYRFVFFHREYICVYSVCRTMLLLTVLKIISRRLFSGEHERYSEAQGCPLCETRNEYINELEAWSSRICASRLTRPFVSGSCPRYLEYEGKIRKPERVDSGS